MSGTAVLQAGVSEVGDDSGANEVVVPIDRDAQLAEERRARFIELHELCAVLHDQIVSLFFTDVGIRFPTLSNPVITIELPSTAYQGLHEAARHLLLGWRGSNGLRLKDSEIVTTQSKAPLSTPAKTPPPALRLVTEPDTPPEQSDASTKQTEGEAA